MVGTRVWAWDFEVDGIYYNVVSIDDLTCEIAPEDGSRSYYRGDFTIPSVVQYKGKELKVVQIGQNAFAFCTGLTSVTIPEGITRIGNNAFSGCKYLVSVQIPSTVKSIGSNVFYNCNSLVSIVLPKIMDSIGLQAFAYCTSLKQITIPNGVTSIQEFTFQGCSSLVDISISQSVRNIEKSAFEECTALENINMPDGLEIIGESAFKGCTALKEFTVPSSCNEIRDYAFNGCTSLVNLIIKDGDADTEPLIFGYSFLRNNNAHYYAELFSGSNLETLYLGRITKSYKLDSSVYYRSYSNDGIFGKNLKSITIGNNITDDIYNSAVNYFFEKQGGSLYERTTPYYRHITFGRGIKTIPDLSFNRLDSIVVINDNPPSARNFSNMTFIDGKLYVPKGCKEIYASAPVWKNFWNIYELEQDIYSSGINVQENNIKRSEVSRYTIGGALIKNPQKGVNIIKMGDGAVKKVVVK